jgi:hypothetical protein
MQKLDERFLKKFLTLVTIFIASLFGILALDRFTVYFENNKVLTPVSLMNFSFDVIGAFVPFCLGLMFLLLYVRMKFPLKLYFGCFIISVLAAFFMVRAVPDKGLMGSVIQFSFVISLLVIFCFLLFLFYKERALWNFGKNYYLASLFVAMSCSPLSKIVVDLFYLPQFNNATIGGNGIADGVFLSLMYAPVTLTLITSMLLIVLLIARELVKKTK